MPARQSPESAAATLLAWLRDNLTLADDTPIPLETLTTWLGLTIETFDPALYPNTLGFLEPGEDLIFVRAQLPESMRRFTLAHELGHAALHRREGLAAEIAQRGAAAWAWPDDATDDAICDGADLETAPTDDDDETLRPGQAYSVRAQREGEANAFAAALLLPDAATRAAYAALCAEDVERPALALAQRFAVSEEVALRRLATLLHAPPSDSEAAEPAPSEAQEPAPPVLDADQRKAARARTPALVVAGPGSGKTSALLARIAYLTDERSVAPERVLALTFSRKAAGELRARLARLLGDQAAAPRVSTIHAFCGDILRQYGPLVGLRADYRLLTPVEGYFVLRAIVNRAPLTHYTPLSGPKMYLRDLLNAISRAKDDLITPAEYRTAAEAMAQRADDPESQLDAERALEAASVYAAYQEALDARGDADYGDLIARTWRLLCEQPQIAEDLRARYEQILVDEFQDINAAMGALLRELAGRRGALWAVGDVDQAIYRFRGASPSNLLRFTRDFDHARVIRLERNYRSRPGILRAASAFASAYLPGEERVALKASRRASDSADGVEQDDGQGGAAAVLLAAATDEEAEMDGLAQALRRRAAAGIPLREQAVLLRANGYVKQVCEGLRARGVPAQLAAPLFDQPLIKTLLATLSLTSDRLASGVLRAGALPDHPFSEDDARALLRLARERRVAPLEATLLAETQTLLSASGAIGLRRLARIIAELRAAPSVAVGLGRYIFSLTTLGARLLRDDMRAEAGQVARLIEICGAFDAQRAAGALSNAATASDSPESDAAPQTANWEGLFDYVSALRELGRETSAVDATEANDAALVMTAHGGKGLEFPVVYLPQLAANRFPARARKVAVPAPPGLLREQDPTDTDNLVEEASAFYVAMTRARDTLVLSYASRYGKQNASPSPFLAPIEQALGDELPRVRWERTEASTSPTAEQPAPEEQPEAEPITIPLAQLEAYLLCPQQYAYQYVYGLQPSAAPYVSLRVALREASGVLSEGFASGQAPTLEDALARFRASWNAARAEAMRQDGREDAVERDDAMAAVYQQHGERAIERRWRELRDGDAPTAAEPQTAAPQAVSVILAGATIIGALDRVEQIEQRGEVGQPTDGASGGRASGAAATPSAVRVARLQSGKLDGSATLRDLFHALATEQMRQEGHEAEAVRVSLASGEAKPLRVLTKRRQTLENEVSAALDGLAHASYPPRPDARTCAVCPFALICPA